MTSSRKQFACGYVRFWGFLSAIVVLVSVRTRGAPTLPSLTPATRGRRGYCLQLGGDGQFAVVVGADLARIARVIAPVFAVHHKLVFIAAGFQYQLGCEAVLGVWAFHLVARLVPLIELARKIDGLRSGFRWILELDLISAVVQRLCLREAQPKILIGRRHIEIAN